MTSRLVSGPLCFTNISSTRHQLLVSTVSGPLLSVQILNNRRESIYISLVINCLLVSTTDDESFGFWKFVFAISA